MPFVWTALHDYGGDMGTKGNLSKINALPFAAPPLAPIPTGYDSRAQAVGVGYTPEGLDQVSGPRRHRQCLDPYDFQLKFSVCAVPAPDH